MVFCYGNELDSSMVNFDGNYPYGNARNEGCSDRTWPVGHSKPNAWGLYDMHGNVKEWCSDWFGDYQTAAVTDPKGPRTGLKRVHRGGSLIHEGVDCRSASRDGDSPEWSIGFLGFRLARTASRP